MRKLRTVLSTAVAVVVMGASVLAATTAEFKNLYFKGEDNWSAGPYSFVQEKEHTMTTSFQYVKDKGIMTLQITQRIAGIHFKKAEAEVYVTNKYGGIQTAFKLDGKVKKNKDMYYRILTENAYNSKEDVEIKILNYKDNVNYN